MNDNRLIMTPKNIVECLQHTRSCFRSDCEKCFFEGEHVEEKYDIIQLLVERVKELENAV